MKYEKFNIENIKREINKTDFIKICKINDKDFTRKRKVMPKDIILYELNKKGLSTKMEIINFITFIFKHNKRDRILSLKLITLEINSIFFL